MVVPGGLDHFHPAYLDSGNWQTWPEGVTNDGSEDAELPLGHAFFITTDATLHALHFIFDNLLTDLEKVSFYPLLTQKVVTPALQAAHTQTQATAGTALKRRAAQLFLAVAGIARARSASPIIDGGHERGDAAGGDGSGRPGQLDVPF